MADSIFLTDTAFWLGLLHARDQYHQRAVRWQKFLVRRRAKLVVPELVMWELLNALAAPEFRLKAMAFYRVCGRDPTFRLIPFEGGLKSESIDYYESRADKAWSLTDCFSFVVMREEGLTQAITSDHHFRQAGFEPLLLNDPE